MMRIIPLAFALSWDSFIVGVVDGSFAICGASKLRMVLLFAVYDAIAAAVGLLFNGLSSQLEPMSAAVWLASWLVLILLLADRFVGGAARARQWPVHLLPFLFCIDNLAAGPALASTSVSSAICCGLVGAVSGLLFFFGRTGGNFAAAQFMRAGFDFRISGGRIRVTTNLPS